MTNPASPTVETTEQVVQRLNVKYALLEGKGVICEKADGGFSIERTNAFHEWHANDKHYILDDKGRDVAMTASRIWMGSKERRSFIGIVFKPGAVASKGEYNLWKGWGVEPNPDASCDLILRHIREVISSDDAALYDYNIKYDAHMVQRPEEKPGVARVLRGGRGVGKDAYGVLLGRICGPHYTHIGDSERLTARFNSMFESAILAHAEEAYWAGDRGKRGMLQHLITSPDIQIERKGVEPFKVDSYLRILMTTNETWAVPAGDDERRYFVTDVSPRYKQKRAYFDPLFAEISGDGAGAYLHYLLNVDLTGFDIRRVPQTEALSDQKRESLDALAQWWEGGLYTGKLWSGRFSDGAGDTSGIISCSDLFDRYEAFVKARRYSGDPIPKPAFGKRIRKLCPGLSDGGRLGARNNRDRFYVLPPLSDCERAFERAIGVRKRRSKADLLG